MFMSVIFSSRGNNHLVFFSVFNRKNMLNKNTKTEILTENHVYKLLYMQETSKRSISTERGCSAAEGQYGSPAKSCSSSH